MKKQPLLILSGFLLLFSVLSSCSTSCEKGSGKSASEDRKLDAFTKLNFSGSYKVVLKQGNPSVKVTADYNLLKLIETSVSGDELTIKMKKGVCNAGTMEIDISNPDYQSVKTAGTIDLNSDGKLNLKDFSMELAGISKVNLNLIAANVTTSTSGSSEVNLTGQATSNQVTMSGKSSLNALDFIVANYRIETSGFSSCNVNALNELNVNISGAGSVQYKGNPQKISNEHSGATSIKKIQ